MGAVGRAWPVATLPCLLLVGCVGRVGVAGPSPSGDGSAAGRDAMRFLALGDSYTIGESVDPEARWPVLLAALLRDRGAAIAAPTIIAKTGWTTDELLAGIAQEDPGGPFDLVTLLVGVNDQYRGLGVEPYRDRFREALRKAVALAGAAPGRVVVLSIPDWGVTPFAEGRDRSRIAAEIDRFNAVNREETEAAGARYVDVTPSSRQAAADPSLLAADGLHPSGSMYASWARLALPEALAALGRGAPRGSRG